MHPLDALTASLASRRDLGPDEMAVAADALAGTEAGDARKEAFLLALADKGETPAEVAALAAAFRSKAIDPGVGEWAGNAVDIVGTGGDHAGGFNVSSLVVLVLASAGIVVMKHGNRGITSRCGSADLLGALGVDIEAPPARSREALAALGFAFFFAPAYHPAFRNIAPVRKALAARGRRTVFNILGPLVNPGRPAHVLLGVYAASWVPTLASALEALGAKAGLAVHGSISPERGIDELTTATTNRVRGFGALRGVSADWVAADFNLPAAPFSDLAGGGVADNVRLVDSLLAGRGPAGLADTIALNASVAMWICGRTPEPGAGIGRARDLLLGGAVRDKIAAAKEFYGKR